MDKLLQQKLAHLAIMKLSKRADRIVSHPFFHPFAVMRANWILARQAKLQPFHEGCPLCK